MGSIAPSETNLHRNFAALLMPMKYRAQKNLAAFAILLASALPAQALDCLPDPDPACVFQMALLQADAEPKPAAQVLGYLTVAYRQTASGQGDAQFTMTVLGSKLQRRNLTPEGMNEALGFGMFGYVLSESWAPDDLEARLWVAGATESLVQQLILTRTGKPTPDTDAMTEAEEAAMIARVDAAAPDQLANYARLTAAGIAANNRGHSLLGLGTRLTDLQAAELEYLIGKFAFRVAERLIASWPEQADRAAGYSALAMHLARAGENRRAVAILTERPELRDLGDLSNGSIKDLAETWARAGEADKAQELLAHAGPVYRDYLPKFAAIAAAVAGDFDGAANQLQTIEDAEDRRYATSQTVEAYLTSGQTGTADFLAALPPDLRLSGILGTGIYQARTGDLEGALATHDQLRAMAAKDLPLDLRLKLAPLLAAMGRGDEAVMMAQELGVAWITAEVARLTK
jgi:hypothetical protein